MWDGKTFLWVDHQKAVVNILMMFGVWSWMKYQSCFSILTVCLPFIEVYSLLRCSSLERNHRLRNSNIRIRGKLRYQRHLRGRRHQCWWRAPTAAHPSTADATGNILAEITIGRVEAAVEGVPGGAPASSTTTKNKQFSRYLYSLIKRLKGDNILSKYSF